MFHINIPFDPFGLNLNSSLHFEPQRPENPESLLENQALLSDFPFTGPYYVLDDFIPDFPRLPFYLPSFLIKNVVF